ncbi:MAG: response regulator transcription factor [Actinobacteria bacterium]|nr:response regulator transcription factor [Actinomycetota bacterium]
MNERILYVEDDDSLRESATLVLERVGFSVTAVGDGQKALDNFSSSRFDLVLLDVMLPSVDGFDVCREIRRRARTPIVMLTARTETAEVVAGLELGADDYVTKPFEGSELVARVRAVLRRGVPDSESTVLRVGGLEIDADAFRVSNDGIAVELTATEFRLLLELVRHSGRVLTRELLLDLVWGYDYLGDSRLVDMAVKRVRDKLGDDPRTPRYITTVRGVGYRFDEP